MIAGLREAARILRQHAAMLRFKDEHQAAAWAESEAQVMDARAEQEGRAPPPRVISIVCPWCKRELLLP